MNLLRTLMLVTLGSLAIAEVKNYECIPSGYSRVCILENIYYQSNSTIIYVFPNGQKHIRIGSSTIWQNKYSKIPAFDAGLYLMLGKPPILEAIGVGIETLDILPSLKHGNFKNNNIRTVWVTAHEGDNAAIALVYLDLSQNYISELPNGIGKLGNLEILNLASNSIEAIPPSTLTKLTKLKVLKLSYNSLHQFSSELFPTSLTHLDLYYNNLKQLNYSELQFPALETLNLERNRLTQIDAPALMLAMPQLKTVRISGNHFSEDHFLSAVENLRRRNITFRNEADEVACYYDENVVEGVCLHQVAEPMGVPQAVLFTLIVVMVGVVFVLVTRWMLRQMSK